MKNPDLSPMPLGVFAVVPGSPIPILSLNVPPFAETSCKTVTVSAPKNNGGTIYVGRIDMVYSTLVGVVCLVSPGQTVPIPYNMTGGNITDMRRFSIDGDTAGDRAIATALFE